MATKPALDVVLDIDPNHRNIEFGVGNNRKNMTISLASRTTPLPPFDGPYYVIPILYDDQVFETYGKRMIENMTVGPIPISETINEYGGLTVVIG